MKNKLVMIFDDESKVYGIEKSYIFNNELDAKDYFSSNETIKSIEIYPDKGYFYLKTISWSRCGKALWAKDNT
jgi:hypothetical protein